MLIINIIFIGYQPSRYFLKRLRRGLFDCGLMLSNSWSPAIMMLHSTRQQDQPSFNLTGDTSFTVDGLIFING